MPKMKFSDANVRKVGLADKTTWYSHDGDKYAGLRLCVGKTAKSWYLSKRNPTTGKVQSIQLGRFPGMGIDLASQAAEAQASDIHNGALGDAPMRTLRDAFERHCDVKRGSDKLGAETERAYRSTLKANATDLLDTKLERITHAALQNRVNDLQRAGKAATARLLKAVIHAAFKQARKQRPSLINPAEGIELRSATKRKTLTRTGDDLTPLLDGIMGVPTLQRRMAWIVMLFTGIRSTNVRTLRWDQVDLDAMTVHLPKMKNGEERTLPISDVVVAAFKQVEGLDPILCFPSDKKREVPIYHLDRLDGIARQHDTRHHFTTAGGQAQLPDYTLAYLRGDKMSAGAHDMVAHYLGAVGSHAHVNAIAEAITGKCGTTSASLIERLSVVA